MMFQSGSGNWTQDRAQFNLSRSDEIDLHFGKRDRGLSYWEAITGVTDVVYDTVDRSQGVRPARNRVRRQAAFNGCHKAARNGRYRSPSDGPGVVMSSDPNKHQKVGEGVMVASVEPTVRVKVRDKLRVAMRPSRLHVFDAKTEAAI